MGRTEVTARAPRVFDGFEVLHQIGSGAMGAVYLARDIALERKVAIKLISPKLHDPIARQRLLREARAIARLQHPNIVSIYRIGDVAGQPYIAYEFVDGRSLDLLPRPTDWLTVLRIGLGLSRGVAAAHHRGILHRDLKPANVMMSSGGELKILDFGLAQIAEPESLSEGSSAALLTLGEEATEPRLPIDAMIIDSTEEVTRSLSTSLTLSKEAPPPGKPTQEGLSIDGQLAGTPLYMAPELWRGAAASRRSDIYSLGLLLYELLVGRLPHAHLRITELPRFVTSSELPVLASQLPDVPEGLKRLIDRCVAHSANDRPAHVDIVRDELEALAAIYVPLGNVSVAGVDASVNRISASFLRVSRQGDHLAQIFYQHLFRLAPQLRPLFSEDLSVQHRMLMAALKLCVENLRQTQRLVPYLLELGHRHARYGVQSQHLSLMGQALLEALASIDDAWCHETEAAWAHAYEHIAKIIEQGMDKEPRSDAALVTSVLKRRWEMPLTTSLTQWADADDGNVAFVRQGIVGSDLLISGEWVTHLEQSVQFPAVASFYRQLASFCRVLRFDRRGCGMSSRPAQPSIDHHVADIRAVMDAAGVDRATLLGIGDGCIAAALFAALHPERVRALILYGSGRLLAESSESAANELALQAQIQAVQNRWGSPLFIETVAPSLQNDPAFRRHWAMLLRHAASPSEAISLLRIAAGSSVRPILSALQAPTLVLHRKADCHRPSSDSQKLAAQIPAARYVELPGEDHAPWGSGSEALLDAIQRFLATVPSEPRSGKFVGCVLAVSCQASHVPPALREQFDRLVAKHRGLTSEAHSERAILGYFDGPVRALRCALSTVQSAVQHHIPVSAAVEVGVMSSAATLSSDAAQRAIRLAHTANPGETLATEAVCEMSAGSGLVFVAHTPLLRRDESEGDLAIFEVRSPSE